MSLRVPGTMPEPSSPPVGVEPMRRETSEKANEFHRRIVEGMTCGVLTVDRDGVITTVNEPARATLDLGTEDVLGRHCHQALAHCPRLAEVLLESFSMASPPSRAEMDIKTRDGRERAIGFSISMIGGDSVQVADGAALFFKDLTKVEEQEERERLRDRLAVLGEMAAQMAHEIRNPLTSIDVSATLQRRRLTAKSEPTDLVQRISEEAKRIEATIANCLDYARPLSLELDRTHPVGLLEESIQLASQRARSRGVVVERRISEGLESFLCDATLLKQSLVNVLFNAYEAMGGDGTITVSMESVAARALHDVATPASGLGHAGAASDEAPGQERFLILKVRDTGPGIPHELHDRVFYPFFTTKTTGSGIGLAAARKVVEAHGGWLDLESEPGNGATFTLKIPMLQAADNGDGGRTS